ncbi:DUF2306 domain-containing protein [Dinoroseobacter sp. S375]|uniref:DUF2306 domain-containing protein n=1 Tax=Dinoroseobacter sp. S375 TaxID=3415136 RepID=UPI003C7DFC33
MTAPAWLRGGALGLVWLLALPFAVYAAVFGWRGLRDDLSAESYLFATGAPGAETALSLHMLSGAGLTALVLVQALPVLRRRWPGLHRSLGRILVAAAGVTALGGLIFIARVGTIGGPLMSAGFTLYGLLMLWAAAETFRYARARRIALHRDWAIRLILLALASWIYRVHYGLWALLTGGWGSTPDFTGPFDRIQMFAFYLPYLALFEILRRRRRQNPLDPAGRSR